MKTITVRLLHYVSFFLMTSMLFCLTEVHSQKKKETRIDEEFPTPISFPYDYLGNYSGNLNISDNIGSFANVPTKFSITKNEDDNAFDYQFSFLKGQKQVISSYKLYIVDETKGYYAIKDNDGLEFMATLIRGTLHITYDTADTIMFTTLQFTNEGKLRFNVIISKKTKNKSKDNINRSNVVQVQKALLSKI